MHETKSSNIFSIMKQMQLQLLKQEEPFILQTIKKERQ
jgi:hypothetical protein